MARIMKNGDMNEIATTNFKFSGVRVDKLGATEYTLVTVCLDMSGSVRGFKKQLVSCIQSIVEACKKSPRANFLLVRVVTFNNDVYEENGFLNLTNIDTTAYTMMVDPRGMTALYDATVNSLEATAEYSRQLDAEEIDVNGIVFVITDGDNTTGKFGTPSAVADARNAIERSEALESLQMFLIGINNDDRYFADYLKTFKDQAGFDDFIVAGDATPETLARVAQFVSKSISNQSASLGTGGPSQVIASF